VKAVSALLKTKADGTRTIGKIALAFHYDDKGSCRLTAHMGSYDGPEINLLDRDQQTTDPAIKEIFAVIAPFSNDALVEAVASPLAWDFSRSWASGPEGKKIEYSA